MTGEIQLWDLATGKKTATLQGHPGEGCFSNMFAVAFSVAFSPDGKVLVSGGARTIELWDVATGKNLATFQQAVGEAVWRMALSPDGKTLAWVGWPQDDPAVAGRRSVRSDCSMSPLAKPPPFSKGTPAESGRWSTAPTGGLSPRVGRTA